MPRAPPNTPNKLNSFAPVVNNISAVKNRDVSYFFFFFCLEHGEKKKGELSTVTMSLVMTSILLTPTCL